MGEFRNYVAGFLFNDRGMVLLVRKTHPGWQANLMNAVGGEIEKPETPHEAMIREFTEEAALRTQDWNKFCTETGPGYRVHFYRCFLTKANANYQPPRANDKGEELEWCDPRSVKYPVIGNLNWLLPMAGDPRHLNVSVTTGDDIRAIATW